METNLASFTDILSDEIPDSQPLSLSNYNDDKKSQEFVAQCTEKPNRPKKHTGQHGEFRSIEEIDPLYRDVFTYPFFNLVQSRVIEDALYSDKSIVVCAPTGSGKTVIFEMAICQLLMEIEAKKYDKDFKIIYMAPVKALCTERLTEWYSKFTKLGLLCIEVTGDTDVDFNQLKPYRIIITTPEKWDMLTRRWRDHRGLVQLIKLFLIDEVHILNDDTRGPVLEAVVSRMKTIESSTQSEHRIEQLQRQYHHNSEENVPVVEPPPRIRFVAVSATVSNPEDVATWLGNADKPAVYYQFGDECRPVKLKRVVEGYPCPDGTSIFKFDIILNYKLWPIIQKYHDGKPTLIFCNTRKSVTLTAEALSREITISFNPEQRAKLTALAATIKNKKLQSLVLAGVGCHHAGLLYEERLNIEIAFRNRDLPFLITTTTLAMGVNLPAHLVIIKNTQQYVNGAYQEYSISTVLQMVGRAGRPQFDTEATAVIMTRMGDKPRYEALVCGSDPLQSYLHKRLPENLNSEAALGTVTDVAQCVQWLRSTFLYVRAAQDPKRYLGLPNNAPSHLISKKIEEMCVRAMNGLASSGLISMDEASCIESTEAGRLMSVFYLDLETMKHIMKIEGTATLEQVLWVVCESHELADMHLRVDERRTLNALNRNNSAQTIRFPMKGKINTRQMKLNCVIQAVLGCLPIPDASLNQEAMKIMRIADRVCKCLVAYVTRPDLISGQPKFFRAVLNSLILAKCISSHIWENSPYVSKQLKGIGPTFSTLLATAGKINFMLLQESHPRDLERIMNKGPPAGNVLRKQISLLPKYQITMTPVDEKLVTMQLTLLNHNYLAENMENLTAGGKHTSHIIVGDSENHLLLLTSFKDKDLIGMYDGVITHQIERKHGFEHTIVVHCVSSMFVGIDAQCEYVFKDLVKLNNLYFNNDPSVNKTAQKQTFITDVYKERKRKNKCDSEISQSKEKKKRESSLAEKIRLLKESFGRTTKNIREEFKKSAVSATSNEIDHEILSINKNAPPKVATLLPHKSHKFIDTGTGITDSNVNNYLKDLNCEDFEGNEYIDDTKIDDILKDIESEISKDGNTKVTDPTDYNINKINRNTFGYPLEKGKKLKKTKKIKKSNFNFLELLDKNVDFGEEEENKPESDAGFSDTIISHVNKYLKQTQTSSKTPNKLINNLIENESGVETENIVCQGDVINLSEAVKIDENISTSEDTLSESKQNIKDHTKNDDSNVCEKTKSDFGNMQAVVPLDKCILPPYNLSTKSKEKDTEYTTNINESNSKQSSSTSLKLPAEVKTNDMRDVLNIPLINKSKSSNENNGCKNVLQINHDVNDNASEVPLNNNQVVSKTAETVHNKLLSDQFTASSKTCDVDLKCCYVRNYSYSTMNVDISTQRSANHHLQIIKKIKVDFDITEIASYNNGRQDKNDSVNCEDARSSTPSHLLHSIGHSNDFKVLGPEKNCLLLAKQTNIATAYGPSPSSLNNFISTQLLKPIACYNQNKDDDKPNFNTKRESGIVIDMNVTDRADASIQFFYPNEQLLLDEEQSTRRLKESKSKTGNVVKSISSSGLDNASFADILDEKYADVKFQDDPPFENAKKIIQAVALSEITAEQSLQTANSIDINKPITKVNAKTDEKKVKDILRKYSQVFRKPKKEDEHIVKIQPYQCNNERLRNTQVHSRPFKITDIDKILPKLPSLLTAETPSYTSLPENIQITVDDNEKDSYITAIETGTTEMLNIQCPKNDLIHEEDMELITQIQTNSPKNQITGEYKIDDSMLNPKTLLKCLIDDEPEIIPPPPEFSDINYSPSQSIENAEYDPKENIDLAILYNDDNVFNRNYVDFDEQQNYCSNEVETLLLSNEDYTETKPWTITHTPTFRNGTDRAYNTIRRTKLDKFKFLNKKKFKIK